MVAWIEHGVLQGCTERALKGTAFRGLQGHPLSVSQHSAKFTIPFVAVLRPPILFTAKLSW